MYTEDNELCFDILNAVIWHLYISGEYRGAQLIEKKRDRQAMDTYDKALEKQQERLKGYEHVDRKHVDLVRRGKKPQDTINLINEINDLSILDKVYFIFITNPVKLKQIEDIKNLYDRVSRCYLSTFEGGKVDTTYTLDQIGDIRATFSSVERAIRFIKEDKPHIFNNRLIGKCKAQESSAKAEFGNSVVGI